MVTGSTGGRSRYVTTGVVIAVVAVITWLTGRQVLGRQAQAIEAAEGPVEFGAPLLTLGEIGAVLLGMAITISIFGVVRAYHRAGDSA